MADKVLFYWNIDSAIAPIGFCYIQKYKKLLLKIK